MNKGAKRTLRKLIIAVPLMFAFGFALVPLYDVFCEVTGLNGKVFQSEHSDNLLTDEGRSIALQFISTNNENMPWTFKPSKQVMKIETGKYHTATFYVKNTTNKRMVAQAVPSVAPSNAAAHLKKLECFCFEQQELMPGEEANLPVRLLVSNDLPSNIKNIILSYTIFDITEYDDEVLALNETSVE
ncbi:MAG: cytochrome c oxidase assembly protein [SAR86 cluster bacterium]|jgi:cytochrome c oxidase assembly protein subunit 11|uniref:Cytochrome c oxidase assembly protein CtaG n=1 Tax=SAR86 cluster bacterium TaxID=2030880 RepID=A0A520MWW0_9GAMM|nr:MAG: cytochrome c oxidase assembly protein [Gammaproteobacteria bacterium TMED225]RZO25718.1 MAG: cytochrome c oxidase assembly protein [SAR86 cluster bacterium]|tara:strand:- start:33 stop:590 length:558 start_codon:yes stop_codon:yes gene_type:complete